MRGLWTILTGVTALMLLLGGLTAQIDPCATGEKPCNPDKPWLRGTVEKSCAPRRGVDRLKREHPGVIVLACACRHQCDPNGKDDDETQGRIWDARCEARCNPAHCACPHPCE